MLLKFKDAIGDNENRAISTENILYIDKQDIGCNGIVIRIRYHHETTLYIEFKDQKSLDQAHQTLLELLNFTEI